MEKTVLTGTGVVPGVAFAPVVRACARPPLPDDGDRIPAGAVDAELERFRDAAAAVAARLADRAAAAGGGAAEVLTATSKLALDRGWHRAAVKEMRDLATAEVAVVRALAGFADMFRAAGGVMAERVTDLEDIRDRMLARLRGLDEPGLPETSGPAVLVAADLAPAEAAALDPSVFVALVTELGGPTSHTAIIARQLGVPCVVAAGPDLRAIPPGCRVLVDGASGVVEIRPAADAARARVAAAAEASERVAAWRGPAATADGHRVRLLANVGDAADARTAADGVAEGIGLFRTELCFLSAAAEPAVAAQAELYAAVLRPFAGRRAVVRTLDAGSDKPLPFAAPGAEENPALGVRGLRASRAAAGLMEHQLTAIARAAAAAGRGGDAPTWVMAPMVATVAEAHWFAGLCRDRGLVPGAMIEVPAAALMARELMGELDFVSIGTNDLTQYTMAADRLSPQLAHLTDPWQPAVLRLIDMICLAGAETGTPVGVCGEAAADPLLACVLAGLGASSLSAAPAALPAVGARLAGATLERCRAAARAALGSPCADAARVAARAALGA